MQRRASEEILRGEVGAELHQALAGLGQPLASGIVQRRPFPHVLIVYRRPRLDQKVEPCWIQPLHVLQSPMQ
jgi:hypothetical protein